jgi:hypothetical protein
MAQRARNPGAQSRQLAWLRQDDVSGAHDRRAARRAVGLRRRGRSGDRQRRRKDSQGGGAGGADKHGRGLPFGRRDRRSCSSKMSAISCALPCSIWASAPKWSSSRSPRARTSRSNIRTCSKPLSLSSLTRPIFSIAAIFFGRAADRNPRRDDAGSAPGARTGAYPLRRAAV